jgi:hypothetical protein
MIMEFDISDKALLRRMRNDIVGSIENKHEYIKNNNLQRYNFK